MWAGGIGLLLAGVVLDYLSWRWLFGIAAIIAVISAFAVYQVIRDAPGQAAARLDLPGAVLLMAGLATLMIGLTKGPDLGWTAPGTLGLFAAGALLLTAWTLVERRVPDPLVDVRMLVRRTVLMTNLATLVAGFAMFATFVIVPVLVEAPRGLADDVVALVDYGFDGSSTLTGLLILPASLSIVVGGVFPRPADQDRPAGAPVRPRPSRHDRGDGGDRSLARGRVAARARDGPVRPGDRRGARTRAHCSSPELCARARPASQWG